MSALEDEQNEKKEKRCPCYCTSTL